MLLLQLMSLSTLVCLLLVHFAELDEAGSLPGEALTTVGRTFLCFPRPVPNCWSRRKC